MTMTPEQKRVKKLEELLLWWERYDDELGHSSEELEMCGCGRCAKNLRLRELAEECRKLTPLLVTPGGDNVH